MPEKKWAEMTPNKGLKGGIFHRNTDNRRDAQGHLFL